MAFQKDCIISLIFHSYNCGFISYSNFNFGKFVLLRNLDHAKEQKIWATNWTKY